MGALGASLLGEDVDLFYIFAASTKRGISKEINQNL